MSMEYDEIVESELAGDNKEVYLFQWLPSVVKYIRESQISDLKTKQADIEKALIKIIASPEPYPTPGRAIRNFVGKCFLELYTRGETRTMFDTLQAFMKIVGDFKAPVDRDGSKIAALSCVGDIMGAFGANVMSFMAEISVVTLKTAKSSSSTLLRYQALVTLKKAISTAKRAVTDATGKDIFKQMRNHLTDKAFPVQRASAEVIIAMYSSDDGTHPTSSDVEAILGLCIKSLDTADQLTRHTLAQLVGHLLASTQVERAVPAPEPAQKQKKDQENADDDAISPPQASAEAKKALMTPTEMLLLISNHFNRPHQSRKVRVGIFDFYAALFTHLGAGWVEINFSLLVAHLMSEIISHPRISSRYETLFLRTLVGILLRDLIGVRMLSEQGQITAIQELSAHYLKRWPAMMPGSVAPSPPVLVLVLREVAGLLQQLGNAPPPVQDALAEPLITVLAHPSHSVRVSAAWALRCFCFSTPLRLPKSILLLMEKLQRDLTLLSTPSSTQGNVGMRAVGHAYGLAALVAVIPDRPLYVSYDVSAKVLDMATQLLKRAGEHELKAASVEVDVAWTMIASLMALGPGFVRPHLPQLLVLWRNALPKFTSKDTQGNSGRSVAEWAFLLHVRENALGAIMCFLQRNSSTLVTLDVARRIASLLSNALSFANGFISQNVEDPAENIHQHPFPPGVKRERGLTLREREHLLRRRVYQCFSQLGFSSIPESTQSSLLQSTLSVFVSPDGYTAGGVGSAVQAAIASSAGTFNSVWTCGDGYGYGVTSGEGVVDFGGVGVDGGLGEGGEGGKGDADKEGRRDHLNRDAVEVSIDALLRKPILSACEHDPLSLCQAKSSAVNESNQLTESPPPATSVVDTAIELFARLLPLQDLSSTVKFIQQLLENVKSQKLEKNAGRKAAIFVNASVALVLALRCATSVGAVQFRAVRDIFGSAQVTGLLAPFLRDALIDGDLVLRSAGSECIGRLASLSGTNHLTSQIKDLVDEVVNNRDPYSRAGCALAFGAIYTHVGGLAAGPLLKTTVNVLMSLSNDPHPVVHFWALNALARVINAASLSYAPFVSGTLGMLLKIYLMDSHEREGGNTINNANLGGECPAYPVVCQIIDAVINVLGPDIRESSRTRELVLSLVREFMEEEDEGICVEAIKCIQHFLMFAPEHIDTTRTVNSFRAHLTSPRQPLKLASINALYQLVQKDALAMSKIGGDRLVEELFGMLDDDYAAVVKGVRGVIESWLKQTVVYNPSAWIDLCQRIMSRTTASQQVVDAATNRGGVGLRDDEGESLNVGGAADSAASAGVGAGGARVLMTAKWRTQLFALQCLHHICTIVAGSGRKEHLDAIVARVQGVPVKGLLFTRISDLIKMAFTASTAYVTEIRLEGLVVLRDIIEIFALSPDPAYDDALLLEQHQAPITAALTPAFSSDSTPEILASAVHACAVFVGCGVVKDVGRMGRILKLLTTALEQSKESGMLSIGDTGELSPNASAMLRISTLSAWAQLQVSTLKQNYLEKVVQPHRSTLSSLWIASLRDYASIRIDSEFLHDASSVAIDSSYSNMGREVLLPYYTQSWPIILRAVATLMQAGDRAVLAAMDGQEPTSRVQNGQAMSKPREDPTAFFYVIFGLVYEALSVSSPDSGSSSLDRQTVVVACLEALKALVRPEYAGKAITEPNIFDEFISLSYRMAMTEPAVVQVHLVEMLGVLAATQGPRSADALSLATPRAHCLRICSHIVKHSTGSSRSPIIQGPPADRIALINTAFATLAAIASSIDTIQREDVRSVATLLYSELLKDETSDIDLISPTFASLKAILSIPVLSEGDSGQRYQRVVHALLSSCLLNIDEMRGRVGVISTRKIKTNMLAAVLILTVVPVAVQVGRAAIEHTCFLVIQKLLENNETSLTAAQCAKTLVATSSTGNPLLRQCVRLLMPGLVDFIARVAPAVHDNSVTEAQMIAVAEISKAFSMFFTSVPDEKRPQLLAVLLPTLCLLLSKGPSGTSPSITPQIVAQILSYATTSPAAFKAAADKLEPPIRELLETSVRKAVGSTTTTTQTAVKPQISLRSF
ncbi:clathrin-coated vesicle protein [Macrolepiota fuliginosa MF-IS2]|uniref:Clathrin-coated vesicle protein n=1 Tax=Macrolepiota fuliginosa MF-IS2 TaxID=1400762 RepID=A0A9P6BY20_9AGAR|nr:clathrin-coated vesicle protein [Macrolepiota fuliginosa MF-IS2]